MSQALIVKDGNGVFRNLQVDSGSAGYISNHSIVSTVTGAIINTYYPYGDPDNGWDWTNDSGTVSVCSLNNDRKAVIVQNNSADGKCYISMGSYSFEDNANYVDAPPRYSFLLDSGATYFADSLTSALKHTVYIPSASNLTNAAAITITVTEIY